MGWTGGKGDRGDGGPHCVKTLRSRYLRGLGVSSRLIEYRSGGFSHVDVWDPSGRGWWCAYSIEVCGVPPGVQLRPPDYYTQLEHSVVLDLDVTDEQFDHFWDFAHHTQGQPYDSHGLIEVFVEGRNWREDGAWWCSEWWIGGIESAGRIGRLHDMITEVTPGDAFMLTCAAQQNPALILP